MTCIRALLIGPSAQSPDRDTVKQLPEKVSDQLIPKTENPSRSFVHKTCKNSDSKTLEIPT